MKERKQKQKREEKRNEKKEMVECFETFQILLKFFRFFFQYIHDRIFMVSLDLCFLRSINMIKTFGSFTSFLIFWTSLNGTGNVIS